MKTEIEVALRDPKTSEAELKAVLNSNLEEIGDLSKLVEILLDMSSLEHSKLEFKKFDLSSAVNEVVKSFNQPADRIKYSYKKHLFINANEQSIKNLVSILLDNALKYSPSDSQIEVSNQKFDGSILITISNSGDGIPSSKLPFIFDRFYRAESSRNKSSISGYGLGLSLAKQIVSVHTGELAVSSEENGLTIFTVSIPSSLD